MPYEDEDFVPLHQLNIQHPPSVGARVQLCNLPRENKELLEGRDAVVVPAPSAQKLSSRGSPKVPPLLLLLYLHLSLPRRFMSV